MHRCAFLREAASSNKSLQPTAQPLRGFASAERGVKSLEGVRRMKGVAAYIERDGDETRLTFDDIEADSAVDPTTWSKTVLYTYNAYPSDDLEAMSLSKEQYAEIGENLLLRLLAINGRLK
jgi:hypothetical protein